MNPQRRHKTGNMHLSNFGEVPLYIKINMGADTLKVDNPIPLSYQWLDDSDKNNQPTNITVQHMFSSHEYKINNSHKFSQISTFLMPWGKCKINVQTFIIRI
jgi:hypothetical protein